MKEKRLLEPQKITAGLISETKSAQGPGKLISVTPETRIADALATMSGMSVTQMPVIQDGRSVGSMRESRVLSKVLRNRELLEATVSELMDDSFPTVDVDTSINEVTSKLQKHQAVLVEEYGRITGIITRHDVLDAPSGG